MKKQRVYCELSTDIFKVLLNLKFMLQRVKPIFALTLRRKQY